MLLRLNSTVDTRLSRPCFCAARRDETVNNSWMGYDNGKMPVLRQYLFMRA